MNLWAWHWCDCKLVFCSDRSQEVKMYVRPCVWNSSKEQASMPDVRGHLDGIRVGAMPCRGLFNSLFTIIRRGMKEPRAQSWLDWHDKHVMKLSKEKPGGAEFHNLVVYPDDARKHSRLRGCCLYPNFLAYLGNILSLVLMDLPFRLFITSI